MKYDVLIQGAGPAGLCAAITLKEHGWNVLVAEQAIFPRTKVCGGFVGPENISFFKKHGLLDKILQAGAQKIDKIHFSVSQKKQSLALPLKKNYALAISRKALDQILWDYAHSLGITLLDGMRVLNITGTKDKQVQLLDVRHQKHGIQEARHVIQACGASRGALSDQKHLFGVSAMFSGVANMKDNVFLHFANQGHVGINQFEDNLTNICYVVQQKKFHQFQGNLEGLFQDMVQENPVLAQQVKQAHRESPWKAVYLMEKSPTTFFKQGAFLAGDALATINPITGGGISMAIQGGHLLGSLLGAENPQTLDEQAIAKAYAHHWTKAYKLRFRLSPILGHIVHSPKIAKTLFSIANSQQLVLSTLFHLTHERKLHAACAL